MPIQVVAALIAAGATVLAAIWANRRPRLIAYMSGTNSFVFPGAGADAGEAGQEREMDGEGREVGPAGEREGAAGEAQAPAARNQGFTVFVYTITIANQGRGVAEDVQISYPRLPWGFSIDPAIQYEIDENPDGSTLVRIPTLGGKEQITIGHMYVGNWVVPSLIRSKGGRATTIEVLPQRVLPDWLQRVLGALVLIGFVYTLIVLFNLGTIVWDVLPAILP